MMKRVSGAFKRSSSSVPKTGGTEAKYLLVIPDDMTDDEKNSILKKSGSDIEAYSSIGNLLVFKTGEARDRDYLTPMDGFESHKNFDIVGPQYFNPGLYVRGEEGSQVFIRARHFARDVLVLKACRLEIALALREVSKGSIKMSWSLASKAEKSGLFSIKAPGVSTEASAERSNNRIELRDAEQAWEPGNGRVCERDPFADDSFALRVLQSGWEEKLKQRQPFSRSFNSEIEVVEARKLDLKLDAGAGGGGVGVTKMTSQTAKYTSAINIEEYFLPSPPGPLSPSLHPNQDLLDKIDDKVVRTLNAFGTSDLDVLIVGPKGAGKTSFIWTIQRALDGSLELDAPLNQGVPADMQIRKSADELDDEDGTYGPGHNHYVVRSGVNKTFALALNDTQGLTENDLDALDEQGMDKVIEWVRHRQGHRDVNDIAPAIGLVVLDAQEMFKKAGFGSKKFEDNVSRSDSWRNLERYSPYLSVFCPIAVLVTKMDHIPADRREDFEDALGALIRGVNRLSSAQIFFVENYHRKTPRDKWADINRKILKTLNHILEEAADRAREHNGPRRVFKKAQQALRELEGG